MTEAWFDPIRFGALYGAIGGGGLGALGGILGALAGYCAPRGKARGFILGAFIVMIIVGIGHLVVGLYALASGQPYGIWYALVLTGGILTVVMGALFPVVRMRYTQAEMRRIQAASLRNG